MIEHTTEQDLFYDFCLWEYRPSVPYVNKLRSVNLLFHTFALQGVNERIFDLVRTIRDAFGISRTVWGVKKMGDTISWEFYFYDYRRTERERSITRLLEIIRPFVRCNIKANEDHHYFMFSVDISDALLSGGADFAEVHMYVGNPGSAVSSGICYLSKESGTRLENFYFFFDAKKHMGDIVSKIACSAYIDFKQTRIERVFWPELVNCKVIVVANKQLNDSVYFSGINLEQLLFFLRRIGYPRETVSYVEENRRNLDHLLYDVGIDYRMVGKDLVILKSGYYGIF